jgi:hypothetical protein
VTAAKKLPQPAAAAPADHDEEITIERRVTVRASGLEVSTRTTTRMTTIDAHLLAMARGEIEPDDPFGGLIPIYDNDDAEAIEVDERWLSLVPAPAAVEGLFGDTVPSVRMRPHEIFALPLEARSVLFLWQIDGERTVEDLTAVCGLDALSALEIIDELLRYGVIDLL